MPKISIIIPCYNTEAYVRKCVHSILAQTFVDFECLLVEDKSPDNCGAICDELALLDRRIRVIHNKENYGASLARKIGLDSAIGKYVLFVDSDDWLESEMIEALHTKAVESDADMVYCDYYEENAEKRILRRIDRYYDKIEAIKKIIVGGFPLQMILWNRLVKRELYNKVSFPRELCGHEDNYIMVQTHFFSGKAVYVDRALYHYVIHKDSMCNAKEMSLNLCLDMLNNMRYIKDFLIVHFGEKFECLFEPFYSQRANEVKHNLLRNKFVDIDTLRGFHPQANRHIFGNKQMKLKHKIYLWIALKLGSAICYKLFCRHRSITQQR
jgi:glycosyltransferase involved in cell wall biosynthesis